MTVTKKDFENVARCFKKIFDGEQSAQDAFITRNVADLAHSVADIFAESNPRFDRMRFLIACGVPVTMR